MTDLLEQARHAAVPARPMTDDAKSGVAATGGAYAYNPISGRFVKKSSATYLRLVKCGLIADPNLYIVQRAAADPAAREAPPLAAAPTSARRAPAPRAPAPRADDDGSDDEDDDLAERIAELLRGRKTKPARGGAGTGAGRPRAIARARITVGPPAGPPARRQVAALFDDSTTDASEGEY